MTEMEKLFKNNTKKPKRKNYQISTIQKNLLDMAYYLDTREYLDDAEILKIEADATFISSLSIRKSATLRKELSIECADETISREFAKRISFGFREQALDTHLQGISIFELVWEFKDGYWFPTPKERDYRDFELSHTEPLRHLLTQETVPPHKAIVGLYSPKFHRLHGKSLYQALFWLVKFKNASIDFWIEYMQRFSSPWIVGSTEGDKDEMAENLYAMLGGDVAVIEEDDKIDLITPTLKAEFAQLSSYADDQIREIMLGGNLLGEVSGASLAASQTHKEILDSIAMMDEHILQELIDQIVDSFREVNHFTADLTITIKDKDAENQARAERDLNIYKTLGGRYAPTKEYIEKTYNIELEEVTPDPKPTPLSQRYSFSSTPPKEHLSTQLPSTQPIESDLLEQISHTLGEATSYEEALSTLEELYSDLDTTQLESTLSHYIANADIYAKAQIESENPHG